MSLLWIKCPICGFEYSCFVWDIECPICFEEEIKWMSVRNVTT
jgi:hypothetical protein